MYALRTRFKKDIVAEFLPPLRKVTKQRVIIWCIGMPAVPAKGELLEFFARKGYWVFLPRYRGTWESGGEFLALSPHEDILDIIDQLPKGFTSAWDGKHFSVKPDAIYVIGSSFGGPAAILASRDPRVTKAVALSPVIDWRIESPAEPFEGLYDFVCDAFGEGYRVSRSRWNKLRGTTGFYNPVDHTRELDGSKLLIVHPKDDGIAPFEATAIFAKNVGARLRAPARGGHLGLSILMDTRWYSELRDFLR